MNKKHRSHISFSELKTWNECAFKHKLVYIDQIKEFLGNEYTAFGTAIHHVCEKVVLDEDTDMLCEFNTKFLEELTLLTEKKVEIKKDLINQMRKQAKHLFSFILPTLKQTFADFKVVSVEERLLVPIDNSELHFKGFIDLVVKTPDGNHHIIDWKTCSWGWDSRKKTDRMTTYQLTLYKHFYSIKHSVDPEKIQTHFALLKRTAKKNNVEIFCVKNGDKKIKNSLKLLNNALYNIKKKRYIKNRLSCTGGYGCEFYKTEFCR